MEVMELAEIKKFFMPSKTRYLKPHAEAMKLRVLWTYDKLPKKTRHNEDVKKLYNLAESYVQENSIPTAFGIINKGLKLDPRYHPFYKMRGDIYYREGSWTKAIRNYETARATVKFDKRIPRNLVPSFYNKKLSNAYWKRGNYYAESGKHPEALYDFEEVLVLKPRGVPEFKVQDKLLTCLRVLDRYEAYRFHWTKFIKSVDTSRASVLLTHHAEYKIFLREMLAARHILSAALELDPTNKEAQAHLQVVLSTGHTMVTYAIIWCTYGCYDKALITVEKGRDCDPYNPGYTLLKAIVLRLSGRLIETAKWLESVDQGFYKLLQPTSDKRESIMGTMTAVQVRSQLIKQWYLMRYDIAVMLMMNDKYQEAIDLLQGSKLKTQFPETYLLLGDCMLKLGKPESALRMYLECRTRTRESWGKVECKKIGLAKRIAGLLNHQAGHSVDAKQYKEGINISKTVVQLLEDDVDDLTKCGTLRGEAYINMSRGYYQRDITNSNVLDFSYRAAADGLCFARGNDQGALYGALFGDKPLESVLDKYATKRKLPFSVKMLMQYS